MTETLLIIVSVFFSATTVLCFWLYTQNKGELESVSLEKFAALNRERLAKDREALLEQRLKEKAVVPAVDRVTIQDKAPAFMKQSYSDNIAGLPDSLDKNAPKKKGGWPKGKSRKAVAH